MLAYTSILELTNGKFYNLLLDELFQPVLKLFYWNFTCALSHFQAIATVHTYAYLLILINKEEFI